MTSKSALSSPPEAKAASAKLVSLSPSPTGTKPTKSPSYPLTSTPKTKPSAPSAHYFPDAQKVNIHTDAGLDVFLSILADRQAGIILADMGGGAGFVTYQWFQFMKDGFAQLGISFTAVG